MNCEDCINRRRFLEISAKLSFFGISLSPISLLTSCGQQSLSPGGGSNSVIPQSANGLYTLKFTDYPSLQTTGGSVRVSIDAKSGLKKLYITRVSSTVATAVSVICTHAGFEINTYDSSTQRYTCSLHGSIFNADGSVFQGPATSALPAYSGTISSTGIELTVS